jgi:hypothetical protein
MNRVGVTRADSAQQPLPPPDVWARHGRKSLGVSVLVAGLLAVLWRDILLPLRLRRSTWPSRSLSRSSWFLSGADYLHIE